MPDDRKPSHEISTAELPSEEAKRSGGVSRRSFLSGLGAAGVAVAAPPALHAAQTAAGAVPEAAPTSAPAAGTVPVTLKVNGKDRQLNIEPRAPCSTPCAKTWICPAPRRAATTASAAPAPSTSTAAA